MRRARLKTVHDTRTQYRHAAHRHALGSRPDRVVLWVVAHAWIIGAAVLSAPAARAELPKSTDFTEAEAVRNDDCLFDGPGCESERGIARADSAPEALPEVPPEVPTVVELVAPSPSFAWQDGEVAEKDLVAQAEIAQAEIAQADASSEVESSEPEELCPDAVDPNEPQSLPPGVLRQRPGREPRYTRFPIYTFETVPDINSSASDFVPVPDRWRQFYVGKWYDPYNQNVLKGDIPVFGSPGHEWFFELGLISETLFERRKLPIPVGFASTDSSQSTDQFGNGLQSIAAQTFIPSFALIRGNTTFRPQDIEFRIVPALNFNHADLDESGAVNIDPSDGSKRDDFQVSFQELFIDYHLKDLTDRYDFISTRVGIQYFTSDFRGFIYSDQQPGARVFGNFANNLYQYNLAYFSRLDKDTNSGLNTMFTDRHEDVLVANVYRQDLIALGHQVQGTLLYRGDTAGNHGAHYDQNGFLVRPAAIGDERPKNVYSTYTGFNTDGHLGRINTTSALYYVFGSESHNAIAEQSTDISAGMAALELSYDIDWIRVRASGFWASGDSDPFDDRAEGFDAVFDNPNFAGGDLSFWQRQGIPLIGGGGVALTSGGSLLPDLRAGKLEGQSNFVNPGIRLVNLGADFELTPKLKLITNASYLQFDDTAVLEAVRHDGSISRDIGYDLSAGGLYRPFLNNNVQFRFGAAMLIPDDGVENLFGDKVLYDFFSNMILQY